MKRLVARLICRCFGHRPTERFTRQPMPGWIQVAEGCTRCGKGELRTFRGQYPMRRNAT